MNLTWQGWMAIAVTVAVVAGMQRRRGSSPDLLFVLGLVLVTLAGIITPREALAGFANPAVITIAALFAVAAGLKTTGVLDWIGHRLLGTATTELSALRRLSIAVTASSAFLLNTPVVAMMVPVAVDWCRKRISASRLLMPVSYFAILGGVCTMLGTSTTLLIDGMLKAEHARRTTIVVGDVARDRQAWFNSQLRGMTLFEPGYVGLPCAVVGVAVFILLGRRLLPNREDMIDQLGEKCREYLVEMLVQEGCRLVGQRVEQAGLRNLPGLFLIEIDRNSEVITPVGPDDMIRVGDRLIFTGVVTTIVDLERIPGLVPAADHTYEVRPSDRRHRHLTEAVLSRTSPLIGTTVREANFRTRYNAAVVAVHRNGVRLTNKIGNIVLEPGDTLLLQTKTDFAANNQHNRDFYLVSSVEESSATWHDRAWVSAILVLILIVWLSAGSWVGAGNWAGFASPAIAAVCVAALMVVCRCLTVSAARKSFDLQVLITIAAALGLGRAISQSGAANEIAVAMINAAQWVQQASGVDPVWLPYILLCAVYLFTVVATEMISNTAVAAMLFPLVVPLAASGGYSPRPFVMAVTLAASLSFITPIGYQTNLMVMGPGGYRPRDYLRAGLPLAIAIMATALLLIPQAWPFLPD